MDLVLQICDNYFLDRVWAGLVPLSAFAISPNPYNASSPVTDFSVIASTSKWARIIARLPHPPIPEDKAAFPYAASDTFESIPQVSAWPRDYVPRQLLSLAVLALIGITTLYLLFATLSYKFVFNHDMMRHPRFLKNQVKLEIQCSLKAILFMTLLTLPWFQAEVMGYTRLYDGLDTYGSMYLILSVPFYLLFTDFCTYWVHRWLHLPFFYKAFHKHHHKWIIPTPFSSYAFHPIDGFLQSAPYHLFILLFPLHRMVYLGLFVAVNFWSIFVHNCDMITGHPLEKVINGPAHHTLHHLYFTCNYGQYFTWADRVGKSYRHPESHLDPLLEIKPLKEE